MKRLVILVAVLAALAAGPAPAMAGTNPCPNGSVGLSWDGAYGISATSWAACNNSNFWDYSWRLERWQTCGYGDGCWVTLYQYTFNNIVPPTWPGLPWNPQGAHNFSFNCYDGGFVGTADYRWSMSWFLYYPTSNEINVSTEKILC